MRSERAMVAPIAPAARRQIRIGIRLKCKADQREAEQRKQQDGRNSPQTAS
jgi:hypothetical protein